MERDIVSLAREASGWMEVAANVLRHEAEVGVRSERGCWGTHHPHR